MFQVVRLHNSQEVLCRHGEEVVRFIILLIQVSTLRIWIRKVFSSDARSIIISVCVHLREVHELIHGLLVLSDLQQFFRFGHGNSILFIIASRRSKIASSLEFIGLGRLL